MKVMTIAGTRPELIRLSRVIPALDEVCEHTFVWTGQNYDPDLSDVFFEELGVRTPDVVLFSNDMRFASSMDWIGSLLGCVKPVLENHKPDRVLILGDTNSAMSAYVAKRMGISTLGLLCQHAGTPGRRDQLLREAGYDAARGRLAAD